MEASFLGVPDVDVWLFALLSLTAFATTLVTTLTGAAGGLLLLAVMALFFPPAVLIPMHTLIQLGAVSSRAFLLRHFIEKSFLLPFFVGAAVGAALGAQIFVALPTGILQAILAVFILFAAWVPSRVRVGSVRGRFAVLGFAATFVGIFVSATGTLVAPVVAAAVDDRRRYTGTFGAVMTLVHLAKFIAFGVLGFAITAYAPLIAAMIASAVLANWAGRFFLDRMKENWFRSIFKVLLTALALRLMWVAASDAGLF
jgi:uncharacterized membrane protein YfcA